MNINNKCLFIQEILFASYFYFILAFSIFLSFACQNFDNEDLIIVLLLIIALPVCFLLTHFAFRFSDKIKISYKNNKSLKSKILVFIISFIASLGILMLWYVAYCPGQFSYDGKLEYDWAINNVYFDNHPFFHTFLCFRIPLLLFGNVESIVLVRIICFAFTIAFLIETLYSYSNKIFAIVSFLIIFINPNTCNIAIIPWKDVAFALSIVFVYCSFYRFYVSKTNNKKNILWSIILAASLTLTICFRHNGLIFAIVIIILSFFVINKKYLVIMLSSFVVFTFAIMVPLRLYLAVNNIGYFTPRIEQYGHAVSTYGYLYHNYPEALDEESKQIMWDIAPEEAWQKYYYQRSGLRLLNHANPDFVQKCYASRAYLGVLKCFLKYPKQTMYGFLQYGCYVYSLWPKCFNSIYLDFAESFYDNFPYIGNPDIKSVLDSYSQAWLAFPIFSSAGLMHLILLLMFLSKCRLNSKKGWCNFMWLIPIILYAFSCFVFCLTWDFRYLYYEFLIFPIILLVLYSDKAKLNSKLSNFKTK